MRKYLDKPAKQEPPKKFKLDLHSTNNFNVKDYVAINTKLLFSIIAYHPLFKKYVKDWPAY